MQTPAHGSHGSPTPEHFSSSLHFWWLAMLRCSQDYWWICQQGGRCADPRLVRIWEQFGDIHAPGDVLTWWLAHGPKLFDSPQIEMRLNPKLIAGLVLLLESDLKRPMPDMVCLAIPATRTAEELLACISAAWDMARVRGRHYNRDAPFQLLSSFIKSTSMVISAYRLSLLQVAVQHAKPGEEMHRWRSYEMGLNLGISPINKPRARDSLERARDKQANIRTMYSQHKKAAQDLIANVEIGLFPCKKPVPFVRRWTAKQQRDLDHAVQSGAWQNAQWLEREHAFMLPNSELLLDGLLGLGLRDRTMAVINDFTQLRKPFLEPKRLRRPQTKKTKIYE